MFSPKFSPKKVKEYDKDQVEWQTAIKLLSYIFIKLEICAATLPPFCLPSVPQPIHHHFENGSHRHPQLASDS
jgi:hypothetical protein